MKIVYLLLIAMVFGVTQRADGKVVRYELVAENKPMNITGEELVDFAITVNGGIPAPTLEFNEGDDAVIVVHNKLPREELSVHWHGLLLPPEMDGVPYVTTPPILPGKSYTFRFKLRQHGTYWYHSHTAAQEQKGVYGAFVIHPKKRDIEYDKEAVVVISDWTDEDPDQILKNLRKDGEYYAYKKDSIRSYWGALQAKGLGTQLANEWTRMGGMDLSDVGYDAFLINGKESAQLVEAHPGERIRLRLVNASASTYFYVSLAGLPMKVIAADGTDIVPVLANEILIGTAETFDVLFTVPEHKNYELRATAQDVSGFASGWIGMGEKVSAPAKPAPDLYASMSMDGAAHAGHGTPQSTPLNSKEAHGNGHGGPHALPERPSPSEKAPAAPAVNGQEHTDHKMDHSKHEAGTHANKKETGTEQGEMFQDLQQKARQKAESIEPAEAMVMTLTTDDIRSPINTELPKDAPVRELKLTLGGDMERYVWFINGETIAQNYRLTIREGEVVRMTFVNDTMMHHPFHLHGHFFRVLNPHGSHSPLKHTVDIPPHGSRTIEFFANEPGDWMLHCHNLYHLKAGMARVVSYAEFRPREEIRNLQKQDPHRHDHLYFDGRVELATNHAQLDLGIQRTWDALEARFESREYDPVEEIEGDVLYRRWFGRFLSVLAGATYLDEFDEDPLRGMVGLHYTLPFLIESTVFLDHRGEFRLDLERRFQWTKYIFSDAELTIRQSIKPEFEVSLMYANSWSWALGLMMTEDSVGLGAEYRY